MNNHAHHTTCLATKGAYELSSDDNTTKVGQEASPNSDVAEFNHAVSSFNETVESGYKVFPDNDAIN